MLHCVCHTTQIDSSLCVYHKVRIFQIWKELSRLCHFSTDRHQFTSAASYTSHAAQVRGCRLCHGHCRLLPWPLLLSLLLSP